MESLPHRLLAILGLLLIASPIDAQPTDAVTACMAVYDNNVRSNYSSISSQTQFFSLYDAYCSASGQLTTSASDASLQVSAEDLPIQFQVAGQTATQDFQQFCENFRSVRYDASNLSVQTSAPVTGGLSDFNSCIALASQGVRVEPTISSAFANLTVHLDGVSVIVQGVDTGPNLKCTSTSFGGGKPLTSNSTATLGANFNIACQRKQELRKGPGGATSNVATSSSIILALSNGAYKLDIPDYELGTAVDGIQMRDALHAASVSLQSAEVGIAQENTQISLGRAAVTDERDRVSSLNVQSAAIYYSAAPFPVLYGSLPYIASTPANIGNIENIMASTAGNSCVGSLGTHGNFVATSSSIKIAQIPPRGYVAFVNWPSTDVGVRAVGCASVRDENSATQSFLGSSSVLYKINPDLLATIQRKATPSPHR